jgi:glycerate kinase
VKIVISMDSFKGSLSAMEAGEAARDGILRVYPEAEIEVAALADGGEGTVRAIVGATGGHFEKVKVHDPLGRLITAEYGVIGGTGTVVMEMAEASGLTLLSEKERNPLETSTFGFGEMIADAIDKGYRDFVIGIGGSATNDGGFGMLRALGFEFYNQEGTPVPLGAKGLRDLSYIKTENARSVLSECRFTVACDVKNPLCGENGCSAVFGPQKGATPDTVKAMDEWLSRYAALTETVVGKDFSSHEGSGAAGGLGFALLAYLHASLRSGAQTVMEAVSLEEKIREADILITGEGKLDRQSFMGKAPVEAAKIAKKYGKTVVAFAGSVSDSACQGDDSVIDAFFPIVSGPCTLAEAMDKEQARKNMSRAAEQAFRLWKAAERTKNC